MTAPHEAGGSRGSTKVGVDLSEYDGKRVALILEKADGSAIAVRGTACYSEDATLGGVLRISPDKTVLGMPVFVVSETDWQGRIYPDVRFGCEVCLDMRSPD